MGTLKSSFLLVSLVVLAFGCGGAAAGGNASGEKVQVAATISVIQDLARQVGGERVAVTTIVPVGGSPETFQPSPRDAGAISEAQVVMRTTITVTPWKRPTTNHRASPRLTRANSPIQSSA